MKKAGFLFIVFAMLTGGMYAQQLVLGFGDRTVTNDTVTVSGPVSQEYFEARVTVMNNTDGPMNVKVRKTEIQSPANGENSFCWGECYTPAVFVSPKDITIHSKVIDRNSFIADYRPNGDAGNSIVRYTFYNAADTTVKSTVVIIWQVGASGINPQESIKPVIRAYPNPADGFITVSLSGQTTGRNRSLMVNMQGQTVQSRISPAGEKQFTWNTANLAAGLYFLKVSDEAGHMSVQKIWIKR